MIFRMNSSVNLFILVSFCFTLFYHQKALSGYESETNLISPEEKAREKQDPTKNEVHLPDPLGIAPPSERQPLSLLHLNQEETFSPYALIVDKSTRTLSIWKFQNNQPILISYYPSDIGREPGNKNILGDLKTPEGIYFFQNRYEANQLNFNEYGSRAFTMDYPNIFDLLSAKTGSGIWLHAIPQDKSLKRGSRGCVVVRNEVIQKITDFITLKQTPIVIHQSVNYVDPNEREKYYQEMNQWLNHWRESWESKNINQYISFYDDSFKSLGMNRNHWKKYKEHLNSRYENIQVSLGQPMIVMHENEAVIRFMQTYRSNFKSDFGEKTLYLKKNSQGQFHIISEEWVENLKKITASQTHQKDNKGDRL